MSIDIDKLNINQRYWFVSSANFIYRPMFLVEIDWLDLESQEIGIIDVETKLTMNADINDRFFKTMMEAMAAAAAILKEKIKELEKEEL